MWVYGEKLQEALLQTDVVFQTTHSSSLYLCCLGSEIKLLAIWSLGFFNQSNVQLRDLGI